MLRTPGTKGEAQMDHLLDHLEPAPNTVVWVATSSLNKVYEHVGVAVGAASSLSLARSGLARLYSR